ncbi:hypothetical protein VHEMI02832 [[Torrubiella] hemipterigena]|uniref:Fungal calcium binding protein domain-containing protein n=1 Tax=[Torrubiella] hemipterigena TaxID=1531966 RepID=A0A0A1TBN2_9HYPO|nr:hypothetical protein VHEMI02832 [[Torrubiella] hemipterigena]
MKFSIVAAATLVAAVSAADNAIPAGRVAIMKSAAEYNAQAAIAGCDWVNCISSLAGATAACAAAFAQGAANPVLDLACLASVGSTGPACRGC